MSFSLFADQISITIDDPGIQSLKNYSSTQINDKILLALKNHQLKALFFVCGKRVDNSEGKKMLEAMTKAGHLLGNHSYSHLNFNSSAVTLEIFKEDLNKNIQFLSKFKNISPYFRFPMLKEGETAEKREGFREELQKKGLINGQVTIDTSDWFISDHLATKVNDGMKDFTRFKNFYFDHVLDRIKYYDSLGKQLGFKNIKHTLLIHHNLLNAYFLDELLKKLKEEGHTLISPIDAYADPIFLRTPHTLPAGESLIWALAKESGKFEKELRYPGEDGEYLKPEMSKIGL